MKKDRTLYFRWNRYRRDGLLKGDFLDQQFFTEWFQSQKIPTGWCLTGVLKSDDKAMDSTTAVAVPYELLSLLHKGKFTDAWHAASGMQGLGSRLLELLCAKAKRSRIEAADVASTPFDAVVAHYGSQALLARAIGVNKSTISVARQEYGGKFSRPMAARIAEDTAYRFSVEQLAGPRIADSRKKSADSA